MSFGILHVEDVGVTMSKKAIRETLTAVGVVASLIFVGYEIRQNTIAARAAAYQAIGIATAAAWDSWAQDRQFSMIRQKTADTMDATDWVQYATKMTVFARLGETVLLQIEGGLLPPDAMERLGYRGWLETFENPKTACIWPSIRPGVSTSFREYVEGTQEADQIDCSSFDIPQLQ